MVEYEKNFDASQLVNQSFWTWQKGPRNVVMPFLTKNTSDEANMDELDVKILQWEADLSRHEAYEEKATSDSMKLSILKGMLPPALTAAVRLHRPRTFGALKILMKEEGKEYREELKTRKPNLGQNSSAIASRDRPRGRR